MYHVLLVEDDPALASAVRRRLEADGLLVSEICDFHNVLEEFLAAKPQLVLLDLLLPFESGFHWCAAIRRVSCVPVLFLSSAADDMNIVTAMNMGGDDFIPKPVEPVVLTAKVRSALRRAYELTANAAFLEFHGALLNLNDGSFSFDGKRVELTKNEFRILQTLLETKGKIVSRDLLMTRLWQNDCYVEENTLTVNVARLRKKLAEAGLPNVIETKPGSGYLAK